MGNTLAELEGAMPAPDCSMLPLPQPFGEMQATQPVELPAGVNVQPDPATSAWYSAQTMHIDKQPMAASPEHPKPSYFHPQPPPPRPGPRPLISETRTHSYDSTASTVLDIPTPYDVPITENPGLHAPSRMSFIMELPSQQKRTKRRPPPLQRRKIEQEPTCCKVCEFYPSPKGRRRKLEKHNLTDGHRRRTGQIVTDRDEFPCPIRVCGSVFNREDNMFQHAKVVHGVHLGGVRTRGRRKQGRRDGDRGTAMEVGSRCELEWKTAWSA
jgi:hypothetical protein